MVTSKQMEEEGKMVTRPKKCGVKCYKMGKIAGCYATQKISDGSNYCSGAVSIARESSLCALGFKTILRYSTFLYELEATINLSAILLANSFS